MLLLLQICFFFVMREISSHEKIRLTLLRLSTSRYLDDLLNIDNIYFDQMVDRIYPTELQLNRANSSDTEAHFLDLNLCISNGTVSTKMHPNKGPLPIRRHVIFFFKEMVNMGRDNVPHGAA